MIKDVEINHQSLKLPESGILNQVKHLLQSYGWYVIRIQQGLGCHRGISDLIAIDRDGNVHFCEIKTPTGKQSEYQQDFQREIELRHGNYHIITSADALWNILREGNGRII